MKKFVPVAFLTLFLFACSTTKKANDTTTSTENMPIKGGRIMTEGIDFRATGNEPFWSLDMDFQGSMHFIDVEGYELTIATGKGEKAMDADVTRYHGETDRGSLTVQIFRQPCENSMSGARSDYTVQVEIKKRGEAQAQTLKGCGNYMGEYLLNQKWTLQSIGTTAITNKENAPTLELNLSEERVTGRAGCNRYFGSFKHDKDKKTLDFSQMGATKMACPDLKTEGQFLAALSGKDLIYKLEEDTLYVGSGNQRLTFKKAN